MKIFKEVMCKIITTFGAALFGHTIVRIIYKDYFASIITLLILLVLLGVGYFTEYFTNDKR